MEKNNYNFVLLGMCCRITQNLIKLNLKNETGLFEWMKSINFNDILSILSKLVNNEDIQITTRNHLKNNYFLDNTDIHTTHYTQNNFEICFKRRAKRFFNQINNNNNKIIFIREDSYSYTTTEDNIKEFIKYIKLINPSCQFKILLLSPRNNFIQITHNLVYHKIYDESKYLHYIQQITF